jgi:hypothetical protein
MKVDCNGLWMDFIAQCDAGGLLFLLKALRGKVSIISKEQIPETLETMVVGCVTGEVC